MPSSPIVTVFGLQFAVIMGGAVLIQSLYYRDWWAPQGTIAFIGVFVATVNKWTGGSSPSLAILTLSLGFGLIGGGISDLLNPKRRKKLA